MKRIITLLLFSVVLLTSCQKEKIVHIVVCQTTDIHGAYFDSLYTDNSINKTSLANVSSYLNSVNEEGYHPILIDCGDNVQGDLAAYYYNFKDTKSKHLFLQMAEYLKYDALVVGNHDIEAGHGVYDRFKSQRRIPYLAANAVIDDSSNSKNGKPYFKEYTIIKRNGIKVAVIGMTNANIKSWLSESQWSGIDFLPITNVAQQIVDKVNQKENPDLVILAIHSGTGSENNDLENCAMYLASNLKDVDIVFGGHDHSPFAEMIPNPNGDIALVNASSKCSYVGRCDIYYNIQNRKIVDKSVSQKLVDIEDYPVDDKFISKFKTQYETVKDFAIAPIGELSGDIDFEDAQNGPSSYLSLIHKVQLESTQADVSIAAPLSSKGIVKAGTLTYQDLTTLYRYENQLFVIVMTGAQLKDYLEYSYDLWINKKGPSYNYDSAEGIDYNVYYNNSYGNRVEITGMSNGTPFDTNAIYKVAMTSYRASGGGNLLKEGAKMNPSTVKIVDTYTDIRTLMYEYITSVGSVKPEVTDNWKFLY